MGKDIHNMARVLYKKTEPYIAKLFPEDQEDVRRFIRKLQPESILGLVFKTLGW